MTQSAELARRVQDAGALLKRVTDGIGAVLVGQQKLVERMLIGMLADGHLLIEGVPGLGKSLAVAALARALGLDFHRIQFTPDLLPADLLGTLVFRPGSGEFTVRKGPIFSELVLADEVNRAPPKVQSALLEAMQERQVTLGETTHALPQPFVVFATQNPIEHEGTYPLPEAELDRFLMKVRLDYPNRSEEVEILRRHGRVVAPPLPKSVVERDALLSARRLVDDIYVDATLIEYLLDVVAATRTPERVGAGELKKSLRLGASPRAALAWLKSAKALSLLRGQEHVTPAELKELAGDVLRHRLLLTFEAEAEGATADSVLEQLLRYIPVP